jgi:glycosyltransferase involved in cell wall biosynthesis
MNIMYLTWGETPRSYGVFDSQVIGQFVETMALLPGSQSLFVSGVPLIHSGLVREKLKYANELKRVKIKLEPTPFEWVNVLMTQNVVIPSRRTFEWIYAGAWNRLRALLERFEPDIVHCRSYQAAWAALQARRRFGGRYRIVFDARGLFPEEVALKRRYLDQSPDYLYLKGIERALLYGCDVTVAVSDNMEAHFRSLGARQVELVYLSASYARLRTSRESMVTPRQRLEFCYVGALSEDTWHKPSSLARIFARLKVDFTDAKLTIVSTSSYGAIRPHFAQWTEADVEITSAKTNEELKRYLLRADLGLMSYFEPKTPREVMLANMVMAVKIAEYSCAGLPVIVNRFCGGAARVIAQHALGVVYDPGMLAALDVKRIRQLVDEPGTRDRISSTAYQLFDYKVHARQYADLYRRLVQASPCE